MAEVGLDEPTEGHRRVLPLIPADLAGSADIDRTECIESIYVREGSHLEEREGDFSAPPWPTEGDSEHSVAAQWAECERYLTGEVGSSPPRIGGSSGSES